MIAYVADAVAFLYYMLDRLPPKSNRAFKEAEEGRAALYLPTIAAAELYYLFKKKGWRMEWTKLRRAMQRHTTFTYYAFTEEVLSLFEEIKAPEIHDKILVSTAKLLKAHALVTKDKELRALGEVRILW